MEVDEEDAVTKVKLQILEEARKDLVEKRQKIYKEPDKDIF